LIKIACRRAADGDDEPLKLDETDPNYLDISQKEE
jgi:hypothetical protein